MARRPVFDRPIAHRGLHDRAAGIIENSASAFAAAIAEGYAIECDLQLTRDGVPVVIHDDDLKRLTGRAGKVGELTAKELTALPLLDSATGECPQTFADLLKQVAGRAMLQVELKRQPRGPAGPRLARKAAEVVHGYGGPLVFESFDPGLIIFVKRFGFQGPRGIITYRYDQPDSDGDLNPGQRLVLRHLLHYPWTRFDFISCEQRSLDLPAVRFLRGLGKPVASWTIRTPQAAASIAGQADQIVFEGFHPDRA